MQQIAEWLANIGLERYAPVFIDNDIDVEVLRYLTDADLEKIGVSLGHRRKLLAAIAELGGRAAAPAQPTGEPNKQETAERRESTPAVVTPVPPSASADAVGERRYLTVMFCDLVGSTGIAAKLDAEEWRDLVGAYLDAASAAVMDMGGHVAKKLGDGLLALFGYPLAHENDAERAARAALSIQRALTELNRENAGSGKPELTARIGLETGSAVVDAAGEIYGDVANIAARVQALAEPSAVLVTAGVLRQVAGLFVAEERGTHTLKGLPEKRVLYRLVRASGGGRRTGQRQLTPLVGRDDEIGMLMRRWERARQGDGQLVMIVGEPGLGKSRLIEEFHSRLAAVPHTWVEWSCSQLLQNTPLHPVAEWGRQRFGGADVPAERRLAELESSLAQVRLDPAENAPLLAPLLDIPLPKERIPALASGEWRRRQLASLTNWVIAGAKVQPVVLAFEDLHWADPTTLDVLRGIAERGALAPLYTVATTRPEFRPPWGMRSHHGTISLAPLDRQQVRDMVAELSARHALARDVVEGVAVRTGGVPLFVEEVTRLLLERGQQGGIQAIPPTLQQSLMARLDRLGPARELAQIGSVIGRGFSYGLLRDVAGMEDTALQAALEKLAEADIVLVQGLPPDSDYRFKHALIQDAAYENLLKSRRQGLHHRVAAILCDRFTAMAAAEPEMLAHHFTQAGLTDAAIEWWGKAGDQALRRSAFQEAISHLGKAIEMADKQSRAAPSRTADAAALERGRAKLSVDYARAMQWRHGFGAEKARAAIERASELAAAAPGQPEYWRLTYARFAAALLRGEFPAAGEIAEAYLRQAEVEGRPEHVVAARRMLGTVKFELGEFSESREEFERMLANWDEERDKDLRVVMGSDVLCVGWSYMAQLLTILGEVENALRMSEDAIRRAETMGDFGSLAFAMGQSLLVVALSGDTEAVLRRAQVFAAVASEKGAELWASNARGWANWARGLLTDDAAGAAAELREIISGKHERQERQNLHNWYGLLAELQGAAGAVDDALASIAKGLELAEQTGSHRMDARLHRLRGDVLARGNPAGAEAAYRDALQIAQEQGARTFALQAALPLAKLLRSADRSLEAHDVLTRATQGFAPMPEFPEIAEAGTTLAALAEDGDVKAESARRDRRVQLQLAYGAALMSARGYGAEETVKAFNRARELSAGVGGSVDRLALAYGTWLVAITTESFEEGNKASAELLAEATQARNGGAIGVAHRAVGATLLYGGLFHKAKRQFDEATSLLRTTDDAELARRFNGAPRAAAHILRAVAAWVTSDFDAAASDAQEAVAQAERADDAMTRGYVYGWAAAFGAVRRDALLTGLNARRLLKLVADTGLHTWAPVAEQLERWSRSMSGDGSFSAGELRAARPTLKGVGHDKILTPIIGVLAAEAEARNGHAAEALALVEELIAEIRASGLRWQEAELLRVSGEARLLGPSADSDPAGRDLKGAIAVAREQGARAFELRAALSLAKLYHSTRRPLEAHDVLVRALEGFSPTPEFPEIAEAQKRVNYFKHARYGLS